MINRWDLLIGEYVRSVGAAISAEVTVIAAEQSERSFSSHIRVSSRDEI
jgi:hypothetical protein